MHTEQSAHDQNHQLPHSLDQQHNFDDKVATINEKLRITLIDQITIPIIEHQLGEQNIIIPTHDATQNQSLWLGLRRGPNDVINFVYSFNLVSSHTDTLRGATVEKVGDGFFLANYLFLRLTQLNENAVGVALYLIENQSQHQADTHNDPEVVQSMAQRQLLMESDVSATNELPVLMTEFEHEHAPTVMTFQPGELGGIGPFDHQLYTDEEIISFLYSDQNQLTNEERDQYAREFKVWQEMRQKLHEAEVIFIPMINGIGDRLYHAGVAVELARYFSDKTVLFQGPDSTLFEPELYAPNLHFVEAGRNEEGNATPGFTSPEILTYIRDRKTFVLNLSSHTSGDRFVLDPKTDIRPSDLTIFDQPSQRDSKAGTLSHTLWSNWKVTMIAPSCNRAEEIASAFPKMTPGRIFVAHQINDYASKIHALADMPISPEFPVFPISELAIPEVASYDYFFVYDAESQGRMGNVILAADVKVIGVQTLRDTFTELFEENPETRIALVKGRTNPEIAEQLQTEFPQITVVENSFQDVLAEGLKSEMIITSDTGFGHFFEAQLGQCRQPDYQGRTPHQVSFFAADSPFPATIFGLRYAQTVLVEGDLFATPASAIVTTIQLN